MIIDAREDVLEALSKYNKIIITGCQRSGTTICSQMLAKDLGVTWVDETDVKNHWPEVLRLVEGQYRFVMQLPANSWRVDLLPEEPDCAVVWIHRPKEQVESSMDRIHWWGHETSERKGYVKRWGYEEEQRNIYDVKHGAWEDHQKPNMPVDFYEMQYHSDYISKHPMFTLKQNRGKKWRNPKYTGHSELLKNTDPRTVNLSRHRER